MSLRQYIFNHIPIGDNSMRETRKLVYTLRKDLNKLDSKISKIEDKDRREKGLTLIKEIKEILTVFENKPH